jgi:thioredoxin-like negative regulator of GroEL
MNPMQAAIDASAERRSVVLFTSPTCGPCKQMKPILQALSERLGFHLSVLSLDCDGVMQQAYSHGVRVAPTFLVLDAGQVVYRHAGATGEERLKKILDEHKVSQLRLDGDNA